PADACRFFAGRAGVLAVATGLVWAGAILAAALGAPLWVVVLVAGLAVPPMLLVTALVAITARRQSADNALAVGEAAEKAIRAVAEHERRHFHRFHAETNARVEAAAKFLEAIDARRLNTRNDLTESIDRLREELESLRDRLGSDPLATKDGEHPASSADQVSSNGTHAAARNGTRPDASPVTTVNRAKNKKKKRSVGGKR
ncbi:MAG: hypothetical protein AAGF47_12270, partial [Planctomycetota bacterium]